MSKFLAVRSVSLYQYFIKAATTDIDMPLQVQLKFWHHTGFFATSYVIMLLCPLLDDWNVKLQWLQEIYWHWIFLLCVWIDFRPRFVNSSFV